MTIATSVRSLAAVGVLACAHPGMGWADVELVSIGVGGAAANGVSGHYGKPSGDGRFVVFDSAASNLVRGDTNGEEDVFVRDRTTRTTRLVSLSGDGAQGNAFSRGGIISQDGRIVAFSSRANNLVPGETRGWTQVFVRDLRAGTIERISVATDGTEGDDNSYASSVSADGRYVAFHSGAPNLVPNDTNGKTDVFLRDRQNGKTFRVSLGAGFAQANGFSEAAVLSADARFVAFQSGASNLVPGDTNGKFDIFVRDRRNQTTRRVSLTQAGAQVNQPSLNPSITPDGRYVAFESYASNLVPRDTNGAYDVFVRDLRRNTTNRVSLGAGFAQADGYSYRPSISADGTRVAFDSDAPNLVTAVFGQHIYLRDRRAKSIQLLSAAPSGVPGNNGSVNPMISADGHTVVFISAATNLVPGATNGEGDVFVATP